MTMTTPITSERPPRRVHRLRPRVDASRIDRAPGDERRSRGRGTPPRRARRGARPCRARTGGRESAGRTATPTAKNVSSAATRSVPEWTASETSPRLCVASPVPSLSAISANAANTDQSAVLSRGFHGRKRTQRSGQDAIGSGGQISASCRNAKWQQCGAPPSVERRDRGQLDLRLRRAEQPAVVVHLGTRVRA